MSYDDGLPLGGFTEDEIAAGVPGLLRGHGHYPNDYYEGEYYEIHDKRARAESKRRGIESSGSVTEQTLRLVATKLVAGLTTHDEIKHKVVKQLLRDQLEFMISAYQREEKLPHQFVWIAKQTDCLEIVIKNYLNSEHDVELTDRLHEEIRSFIKEIQRNLDQQIVYDRVAKIQAFLHRKIDQIHGLGAHFKVRILPIKHLLSACRLHLNLADFKTRDLESLAHLMTESETAAIIECQIAAQLTAWEDTNAIALRPVRLRPGAKGILTYRIRHLRSLLYFAEPRINCKIFDISHLSHDKNIKEFRDNVIDIYCDPKYRRYSKFHWVDYKKISDYWSNLEWLG